MLDMSMKRDDTYFSTSHVSIYSTLILLRSLKRFNTSHVRPPLLLVVVENVDLMGVLLTPPTELMGRLDFVLTDALGDGLGVILTQEGQPITFTSKKLCDSNLVKCG